MKKNMGSADRIIRMIIAAIISVLYFTNILSGTFAIVLMIFAIVFLLTSFVGFCPVYSLLGVKTLTRKHSRN